MKKIINILAVCLIVLFASNVKIFAKEKAETEPAGPMGLFTNIALSLEVTGVNGRDVKLTATNQFTLGPSVIEVKLRLYSSYEADMSTPILEAFKNIGDLNMGNSISAVGYLDGERYFQGEMDYRMDYGSWHYSKTSVFFIYIDGTMEEIS